jgi:hypothetical protein
MAPPPPPNMPSPYRTAGIPSDAAPGVITLRGIDFTSLVVSGFSPGITQMVDVAAAQCGCIDPDTPVMRAIPDSDLLTDLAGRASKEALDEFWRQHRDFILEHGLEKALLLLPAGKALLKRYGLGGISVATLVALGLTAKDYAIEKVDDYTLQKMYGLTPEQLANYRLLKARYDKAFADSAPDGTPLPRPGDPDYRNPNTPGGPW